MFRPSCWFSAVLVWWSFIKLLCIILFKSLPWLSPHLSDESKHCNLELILALLSGIPVFLWGGARGTFIPPNWLTSYVSGKCCPFLPLHLLFLSSAVSLHPNWNFRNSVRASDLTNEQDPVLGTVAGYEEVYDEPACEKQNLGRKHELCTIKGERFNDNSRQQRRK